jgi:ADP-ribose pyrophosphatase YjhB (NUDIX family)
MSDLTKDEIQQAADLLSRIKVGYIPEPIFLEIARISASAILEIVPLRKVSDKVEVLLTKRPDEDPNWPGMLHTPGTVIRSNDTLDSAYERILEKEILITIKPKLHFVESILHQVTRGNELAAVYYIDLTNIEIPTGEYFSSDSLPDSIVDTQIEFIKNAVRAFE